MIQKNTNPINKKKTHIMFIKELGFTENSVEFYIIIEMKCRVKNKIIFL
jgi:hypothetical protein